MTLEAISRFNWRPYYYPNTEVTRGYMQRCEKGTSLPRLTFLQRENGLWYLRVEVSLPKFLKGSNVITLPEQDVFCALDNLSAYVTETSGKTFDAQKASICRVDFVEDTIINESDIYSLFRRLSQVQHPKLKRRTDEDTVYFEPRTKKKYIQVKIYSKYHEVISKKAPLQDVELARGRVRLEVTLRTPEITRVKNKLGLPSRDAEVFLIAQAGMYVLKREKKRINYNKQFVEDDTDVFRRVLKNVDDPSPIYSLGFLLALQLLGPKFYELPQPVTCSLKITP